jgi:NitT/TauT family transport system permease protein
MMSDPALPPSPNAADEPATCWGGGIVPVSTVVAVLLLVWYIAAIPMNRVVAETRVTAAGGGIWNTLAVSWSLDRPVIPAPHQVLIGFWDTVFAVNPASNKSLVYHAWVTLAPTLLGFALGSLLGIGLAIAIVHLRTLQKSLLPWIIASQTIPILAIAPMIIVVLGSLGLTGLLPKSLISMYLCFFPVTIGMVKGLTSPEVMQLDLMHTYNASASQTLRKLRFPAALPLLFASLKVAISIALVGAIVGELPTGAQAGIGARLLTGSYYGQTVQIWAALLAAALMAGVLVAAVELAEGVTNRLMGARS